MLQRTLNRTAYYTSLVISFLVFLAIWLNLIVLEVSHLTKPDTVAVSSIAGPGEKIPAGKIIPFSYLTKLGNSGVPDWQGSENQAGKVWEAIVYFPAEMKPTHAHGLSGVSWTLPDGNVREAVLLNGQEIYGVVEGKFQFFPVVIKKSPGQKKIEFDLPSGPVEVETGARVTSIDDKKASLIKSLIYQRENRSFFRQMIGASPVKETITGTFVDTHSSDAPKTNCMDPICYVYKPSEYKDFYKLNVDGRPFDLVLTFDGQGSFKSADYKGGTK